MIRTALFCLLLLSALQTQAQTSAPADKEDSTKRATLDQITINAYENNTTIQATPSAIGRLSERELSQLSDYNILPIINTLPGIKMEERSPGSYRLGIRGSAYNSPFGVRNVKVYYNDIPYTEPSGSTYLNQLGNYNFNSVEIIREPGSSIYGAGTGGVMLINSTAKVWSPSTTVFYTGGSYNYHSLAAEVKVGGINNQNTIRYQRLSYDGYRAHSELLKSILSWDNRAQISKHTYLNTSFLYGDLQYETPGGLTEQQYLQDPTQARPAVGPAAGSIEKKAAVNQKTVLLGTTLNYQPSKSWEHKTTIYTKHTKLDNPSIRNYSIVTQPSYGGRSTLKYKWTNSQVNFNWILGAEAQLGTSYENTYDNIHGNPDTLRQENHITYTTIVGFTQASLTYKKWLLTTGASLNNINIGVAQRYPISSPQNNTNYNNEVAPRVALSYKVRRFHHIYASFSKGYAVPTIEELAPTGSSLNLNLKPTTIWNYQAGVKGNALHNKLYYDLCLYKADLTNAIVQRRDAFGGDYYVNAGGVSKYGLEALVKYNLYTTDQERLFVNNLDLSISYTYSHFTYAAFVQLDKDYSDNTLPGVSPHTLSANLQILFTKQFYLNVNGYYSDRIFLDDANSFTSDPYLLVNMKVGKKLHWRSYSSELFVGINNLLNQTYSLGNDINAFGGRYYNAAAPINYFVGISLSRQY